MTHTRKFNFKLVHFQQFSVNYKENNCIKLETCEIAACCETSGAASVWIESGS